MIPLPEDELNVLFRAMREEPVPPDSLVRVRERVALRTAAGPRRTRWWKLSAALTFATACLATIAYLRNPPALPAPPPVAARLLPQAPKELAVSAAVQQRPTQPSRRILPAQPEQSNLIRIDTPDPDVVIFLVASDGGGSD